jgi:hypothetical protein
MVNIKSMIVPAIVAGLAAALFSTVINVASIFVPFIGFCGMACCLWLIAAGFLAAFLTKKMGGKITTQDGAIVGMLTGAVSAVVETVLTAILMVVNLAPAMPGLANLGLLGFGGGGLVGTIILLAIAFMLSLLVEVVFCGIGGVIGAVVLEKK